MHSPTMSDVYVKVMLPGLIKGWGDHEPLIEKVPPQYVLGSSWQGHAAPDDPYALMDRLNQPQSHSDLAQYHRLGHLPLYEAQEGKNRVELFRRYNRDIRAGVRVAKLRSNEDIKVGMDRSRTIWLTRWVEEDYGGGTTKHTEAIPFPDVTLPNFRQSNIAS